MPRGSPSAKAPQPKRLPFKKSPLRPTHTAEETTAILEQLYAQHPGAFTELNFSTPFQLLVATILSAQSTDRRVNEVTPALFERYPDAAALASASTADLERMIKATGFFRQKSKALIGAATALVARHGGEVPADMAALTALPGVGRKTANVVLGHALGVPGLPVDRHVLRVANRIGIAQAPTPELVETQLTAVVPRDTWTLTSDTLILHGRRICRPRPLCERCAVVERCDFARRWHREAASTFPAGAGQPLSPRAATRSTSHVSGKRTEKSSAPVPASDPPARVRRATTKPRSRS